MTRALVTGAVTAKAYRVKNTLPNNEVVLGDYDALPEVMIAAGVMLKLPDPAQSSYIHEMLALCLDKEISVILPVRRVEFELLQEAGQLFSEYGITIQQVDDAL